ncbi:restriction endonuclease subunit S [Mycolicibacterium fortuitum]|uniref:restriction endonuclease subunit S n=1 Tax=Mycolicibacterium fortuitum TaxID=1766 RepID=UPI0007EA7B37|nr:restriction endonuclease subunit S [Mycolicibacterium fortuitum]OBB22077.1 hypothetical protein A5763_03915 [Mycolicibacterium fortuitum]OBB43453.1 hypothetical protein A5754_01675 [Mycolicibacterium fortuitum]OBB56900.1 hypothetical protein A5755_27535 [Mycolicibacterium fortuitum]OBF86465.1 hypothetical protein A5751_08440 [Mycolicibacterium fortuitum]OBG11363.1 hypothetical protein A5768_12675 [Mycolicibacterium fortuitum]
MTTIGDLVIDAQVGFACGKEDPDGVFQFRMNNVSKDSTLDLDKRRRVPPDANRQLSNYLVQPGDVLFNATNSPDNVGKSILVPEIDEPAVFSNHFIRLRVDNQRLDSAFLWRWLQWQFQRGTFHSMCRQWVNQATVSRESLLRLTIDVPLPDEQRRITAILDHADALRARRVSTIEKLDGLVESIYLNLFEDFAGKFAAVSEIASSENGSIRTGPFGSQLLHSEFVEEGVAVLGLDNVVGNTFNWGERRYITPSKYDTLQRYTVRPGDVLISIMGTCGRCVVVPADIGLAINTKHICAITLDPEIALPEFVRATFLWHPSARHHLAQRTKGSIMDGLNMGIIKDMPVPLPDLDVQHDFVTQAIGTDQSRKSLVASRHHLDELFISLQSRAFRGEL